MSIGLALMQWSMIAKAIAVELGCGINQSRRRVFDCWVLEDVSMKDEGSGVPSPMLDPRQSSMEHWSLTVLDHGVLHGAGVPHGVGAALDCDRELRRSLGMNVPFSSLDKDRSHVFPTARCASSEDGHHDADPTSPMSIGVGAEIL
ncbi:hypothetical protein Dimus_034858 [Dionaea muscipula]